MKTFCGFFLALFCVKNSHLCDGFHFMKMVMLKSSSTPRITSKTSPLSMNTNNLNALRLEAISNFIPNTNGTKFSPTSGGVNNFMDYVSMPSITTGHDNTNSEIKYVLRIYNNGLNSKRVEFEHRVLDEVSAIGKFSFDLPTALKSIKTGQSHVVLSNGAEASLFNYIPGVLPKKQCVREIGQAAGSLITAMGKVKIDLESPNPAYYDLYKAHHAISRDIFYSELQKPIFTADAHVKKYIDLLVNEIKEIEVFIAKVQALNPPLPRQLIHGDLHYDNILAFPEQKKVTGLLDFEFCAFDWRAMELAVCLSKYADKPDEAMEIFRKFVDGFSEEGILTSQEINMIPELIILRILSNVVYFMGRAVAGEDTYDCLTTRAQNYYNRIEWLKINRQEIVDIVANKMIKS